MSTTKQLARDFVFELNTGTVGSPVWVTVSAVNNWSHKPEKNDADTTTFDEAGWKTHLPASRGNSYTVEGLYKEDADTGDRDAAQTAMESWAAGIGPDGLWQFRITSPGGNTWTFIGSATLTNGGGGNDDPAAFSAEVTVSGAVTSSTLAAVPAAPTSADATAANDAITGTWTPPAGTIELYEVVVYEDAGDTVVATVTTSNPAVYVTGLSNATAYYFKVRARTSGGWGPYSSVSDTVTTT